MSELDRLEHDFEYHAPKEGQAERYKQIRDHGKALATAIIALCPV